MSVIQTVSEIPAAAFYVLSNDNFMSDFGPAKGKTNTCIVPCQSLEMAEAVRDYVQTRPEQKYIRIVSKRPRSKPHVLYSVVMGWTERAREYSNLRPEFITW